MPRCPRRTSTAWAGARTARKSAPPAPWSKTRRWPDVPLRVRSSWRSAPATRLSGRPFPAQTALPHPGVGLLDIATVKGTGPRAVGEVVGEPGDDVPGTLPTLPGFENHGGQTTLGPDVTPLARVLHGVGNGDGSGTEGAVSGRVLGTYLHGPVLARNPALADLLLGWALEEDPTGDRPPSDSFDDRAAEALREERLTATVGSRRRRGRLRRRR
jgi:lipid II isoglutaminyl synthase (glutamine-hydrolysing)